MSTHGAVLAAVQKQREKQAEKEALRAREREKEEELRRQELARIEVEKKKAKAVADLKQALGTADDEIAAKNASHVSMDTLTTVWEDGYMALHSAASQGLFVTCETIMKRRDFQPAMLIATDNRGWTPLHLAVASADHGAEVCALIARHDKCHVGARDNEGRTAVALAQEWGFGGVKKAILEAIAERYAKVQAREVEIIEMEARKASKIGGTDGRFGPTDGLMLLKSGRIQECIALIKTVWPFINQLDDDKNRSRTLLHWAAREGEPDVCEAVLDREDWKRTDQMDLDRATALHLAAANRHVECCIAIVASGRCQAVNQTDMRDQTALHLAAVRGDVECYNAILAHEGIDLSVRDFRDKLAAEYAIERGMDVEMPIIYRPDERDLSIDDPNLEVDV